MCVICVKPTGVAHPTKEVVNQMCEKNPDGFGLATIEDGVIVVKKTMKRKEYWKWIKALPDSAPAVMHMRIATHGSVKVDNCHPFKSDGGKWAFAHNGILSIKSEGDWTDSETFFRRIAMPMINGGYTPETPTFDAMIDCIIGGSKFVFLHESGYLKMYGHFIKEDGLYFSNNSYKKITYGYLSSCYSRYGSIDDYYQDDYSDWWAKSDVAPFDYDECKTKHSSDYYNMDADLYSEIFDSIYDMILDYAFSREECIGYTLDVYPEIDKEAIASIYSDAYDAAMNDLSNPKTK